MNKSYWARAGLSYPKFTRLVNLSAKYLRHLDKTGELTRANWAEHLRFVVNNALEQFLNKLKLDRKSNETHRGR